MPYQETPKPIDNKGEEKLACCIVIDTSGSMGGYEKELEDGIKTMVETIADDDTARGRVEICIIEFNDDAQVLSSFGSVQRTEIPHITTGGCTATHKAIKLAIEKVNARKAEYVNQSVAYKQPWIWLLTDGESNDSDNGSFGTLLDMQNNRKLVFFPFAIGNECRETELKSMQKQGVVYKITRENIIAAFEYLSQSVRTGSVHSAGETFTMPEPDQKKIQITL